MQTVVFRILDNNGGSPNQPVTKKAPKAFSRVICK